MTTGYFRAVGGIDEALCAIPLCLKFCQLAVRGFQSFVSRFVVAKKFVESRLGYNRLAHKVGFVYESYFGGARLYLVKDPLTREF